MVLAVSYSNISEFFTQCDVPRLAFMHSVLDYSRLMSSEVLLRLQIETFLRLMATQMHITDGVQKMMTFSIGKNQCLVFHRRRYYFQGATSQ